MSGHDGWYTLTSSPSERHHATRACSHKLGALVLGGCRRAGMAGPVLEDARVVSCGGFVVRVLCVCVCVCVWVCVCVCVCEGRRQLWRTCADVYVCVRALCACVCVRARVEPH
jgi:hypothetical protein